MQITRGVVPSAQKVVLYGVEGIGKSTFASRFPNPVFIDTEGSTKLMDVARTPRPGSWAMLLEQVRYFKTHPEACGTLVVDTADWAESLCVAELCAKFQKTGIEDFGYGKGYVYLAEEFGKLLNQLEELTGLGMHIVFTAHAKIRKFEQPDEMGAYDRWEMKLGKHTAPLLKEWADMVLLANYKTFVVNVDGQGTEKGKNKAQGGERVMYTSHHPCWDAKNRHGLKPELKLDYAEIAHCIEATGEISMPDISISTPKTDPKPGQQDRMPFEDEDKLPQDRTEPQDESTYEGIPAALAELMKANHVTQEEMQMAVGRKGYYPADTPIGNYDPQFVAGVLVGAWPQVYQMVCDIRKEPCPF